MLLGMRDRRSDARQFAEAAKSKIYLAKTVGFAGRLGYVHLDIVGGL
jgi:hypothetical protein